MRAITYKGQYATVEFDPQDLILVGRLAGIEDIVTFHATTRREWRKPLETPSIRT